LVQQLRVIKSAKGESPDQQDVGKTSHRNSYFSSTDEMEIDQNTGIFTMQILGEKLKGGTGT
jgi:hypothetical protein